MDPKIKMLQKHGYTYDGMINCYIKPHIFNGEEVWKSFIPNTLAKRLSEFDIYKMIKSNEKHAKEFMQAHYGF